MSNGLGKQLVLAISSRTLLDLGNSHRIYETEGIEAYRQYQVELLAQGELPAGGKTAVIRTTAPWREQ